MNIFEKAIQKAEKEYKENISLNPETAEVYKKDNISYINKEETHSKKNIIEKIKSTTKIWWRTLSSSFKSALEISAVVFSFITFLCLYRISRMFARKMRF